MACKKFNPGHYLQNKALTDPAQFSANVSSSIYKGVLVGMFWNLFETDQGVYSDTYVRTWLDWGAAQNKQIIFMFWDRDFAAPAASNRYLPGYLNEQGLVATWTKSTGKSGSVLKVWEPAGYAHRVRVLNEFLDRFDSDPFLESIVLQESSYSSEIAEGSYPGFTREKNITGIMETLRQVGGPHRQTQLIQYAMSALPLPLSQSYQRIIDLLADNCIGGIGNPDQPNWDFGVSADKTALWQQMVSNSGRITTQMGGDTSQYEEPNSIWYDAFEDLIQDQYDLHVGKLGKHYMIWSDSYYSRKVGGQPWTDMYRSAQIKMLSKPQNSLTNEAVPLCICCDEIDSDASGWWAEGYERAMQQVEWFERGKT
jgi:hypothetical protein